MSTETKMETLTKAEESHIERMSEVLRSPTCRNGLRNLLHARQLTRKKKRKKKSLVCVKSV